jgi:lipopolysaccharide/colanic/teichoic acid biosynthesis glycosyltransferase
MARINIKKEMVVEPVSTMPGDDSAYLGSHTKRSIDLFVGLFGLLLTIAIFPLIALFIKIDSRGPIFYRQKRLGLDGESFELIKFRTMVQDAEQNGEAVWASDNDPRITRVGWLLRGLYIDEFPQWWNVLMGEMSVVGPRPERPEMSDLIVKSYPDFSSRVGAKPGITGLAQVEYEYANTVDGSGRKLRFDRVYIQNASLTLDAWIFVRTFRRMLMRRGT